MKLLLTSGGIRNSSIRAALVGLLGKPIAECSALCIPTAAYGHPMAGPVAAWRLISGQDAMCELGWKSMGVLELTALPSIDPAQWVPIVKEVDVLLAGGGDASISATGCGNRGWQSCCRRCASFGWDERWQHGDDTRIGEGFMRWIPPGGGDSALGVVDLRCSPTWKRGYAGQFHGPRGAMGLPLECRHTRLMTRPPSR